MTACELNGGKRLTLMACKFIPTYILDYVRNEEKKTLQVSKREKAEEKHEI